MARARIGETFDVYRDGRGAATRRRPTGSEVRAARPLPKELAAGRNVIALGRLAESVPAAQYVRHPSHGGASEFRAGLLAFLAGGQ